MRTFNINYSDHVYQVIAESLLDAASQFCKSETVVDSIGHVNGPDIDPDEQANGHTEVKLWYPLCGDPDCCGMGYVSCEVWPEPVLDMLAQISELDEQAECWLALIGENT